MSLRAWLRHYLETLTGAAALRVEVERLQHVQQLLERAREEAHCHMLEARALEAELVQVDSKRQALADTLHHTQAQASEASHALEVARETARAVHAELLESTSTGATWALGELAAMGKRVSQLEEECSALRADKQALRQQLSEAHAKQHSLQVEARRACMEAAVARTASEGYREAFHQANAELHRLQALRQQEAA